MPLFNLANCLALALLLVTNPEPARKAAQWVQVAVQSKPPPPPPPIWPWIAALVTFSLAVLSGTVWAWRRFQPKPALPPPEPAWRIAPLPAAA